MSRGTRGASKSKTNPPSTLRYSSGPSGTLSSHLAGFWPELTAPHFRSGQEIQAFFKCGRAVTGFENPRVGGSIPSLGTTTSKPLMLNGTRGFLFWAAAVICRRALPISQADTVCVALSKFNSKQ